MILTLRSSVSVIVVNNEKRWNSSMGCKSETTNHLHYQNKIFIHQMIKNYKLTSLTTNCIRLI